MPYFPDNTHVITNFDPIPGQTSSIQDIEFSLPDIFRDEAFYVPDATGTIPDRAFTVDVPNMPQLLGTDVYSEFRLFTLISPIASQRINGRITYNTAIPNFDNINTPENGLLLDGSQLSFPVTLQYQNLETGIYDEEGAIYLPVLYYIYALRISDGTWVRIKFKQVRHKLQKVLANNFYISPNKVEFNHAVSNTTRPVVTTKLYPGSPVLVSLKDDFELIGNNIPTPSFVFGQVVWAFSSITELQVRLKESADARLDELRTDDIIFEVFFQNNYPGSIKYLRGDILVSSTIEFTFQPQMLNFLMILGANNNFSKTLQVFGNGPWSLGSPSWLSLSTTSGIGVGSVDVEPIDEEYFIPGIYQNDMILTANGKEYKIPVRLKVAERFELGLSKSGLNFTDENQALTKIYNNSFAERYVLVDVEIPQIGYPYATQQPKTFQYRLGFFQNETNIHIGEIVKRSLIHIDAQVVFDLLSGYIQNGVISTNLLEYYKPSSVRVNMQLFNASDNSLIEAQEHKLIRFITGRNPFFEDNLALLRDKNVEQKVSKNSVRLINFVTRKNLVLEVYKNGQLNESYQENISVERLYGLVVSFEAFEIGDEIEYRLYSNAITGSNNFQGQTFIVYPEGKHFNQVVYEDEYRVPQFFDFCGDWRFSTENELIQSTDVINLVEAIQNEKSVKSHSLVMNTGYIPATNQIFVEQLNSSRNCWLLGNETEPIIELVPKAYNMVNYDSDLDLYQYEVEFQINPTNDLQNYS